MNSRKLSILDVGHGNSAILQTEDHNFVIDCGRKVTLINHLYKYDIEEVDDIIVSHTDQDHVGGLTDVLVNKDIQVNRLHINPSSLKSRETIFFNGLISTVKESLRERGLEVNTSVTSNSHRLLQSSSSEIKVLFPPPDLALASEGGTAPDGGTLTPNQLSVVARLDDDGHPVALFPGDIGWNGISRINELGYSLTADILVFPHHGGRPETGSPIDFTVELIERVQPKVVVFSISSGRNTPRTDILEGIEQSNQSPHILCTQLSSHCVAKRDGIPNRLEPPSVSKSFDGVDYCGGTVEISLDGDATDYSSLIGRHTSFLDSHVPEAACRNHCTHLVDVAPYQGS